MKQVLFVFFFFICQFVYSESPYEIIFNSFISEGDDCKFADELFDNKDFVRKIAQDCIESCKDIDSKHFEFFDILEKEKYWFVIFRRKKLGKSIIKKGNEIIVITRENTSVGILINKEERKVQQMMFF